MEQAVSSCDKDIWRPLTVDKPLPTVAKLRVRRIIVDWVWSDSATLGQDSVNFVQIKRG